MANSAPTVLFIPVSGPSGMGEFARTRTIADAMRARCPNIDIHFLLHREAPYARDIQYPCTLLPASATLCTAEVIKAIARLNPKIVCFDNAGRTEQLRYAKRHGATIIYISSRRRQRYKAFRLRWMGLIDEHWISYPPSIAGQLTHLERWKQRWIGQPVVYFLDTVLAPHDEAGADSFLRDFGSPDLLVVPGGGSQFRDASVTPGDFALWAQSLARSGHKVLFIAGPAFKEVVYETAHFKLVRGVTGGVLHSLLKRSRVVLVNGGDTLLQALALGKPCVAIPIANDQPKRIKRCAELDLVVAPESNGVEAACTTLMINEAFRSGLVSRVCAMGLNDALPSIVERLTAYLLEHGVKTQAGES